MTSLVLFSRVNEAAACCGAVWRRESVLVAGWLVGSGWLVGWFWLAGWLVGLLAWLVFDTVGVMLQVPYRLLQAIYKQYRGVQTGLSKQRRAVELMRDTGGDGRGCVCVFVFAFCGSWRVRLALSCADLHRYGVMPHPLQICPPRWQMAGCFRDVVRRRRQNAARALHPCLPQRASCAPAVGVPAAPGCDTHTHVRRRDCNPCQQRRYDTSHAPRHARHARHDDHQHQHLRCGTHPGATGCRCPRPQWCAARSVSGPGAGGAGSNRVRAAPHGGRRTRAGVPAGATRRAHSETAAAAWWQRFFIVVLLLLCQPTAPAPASSPAPVPPQPPRWRRAAGP